MLAATVLSACSSPSTSVQTGAAKPPYDIPIFPGSPAAADIPESSVAEAIQESGDLASAIVAASNGGGKVMIGEGSPYYPGPPTATRCLEYHQTTGASNEYYWEADIVGSAPGDPPTPFAMRVTIDASRGPVAGRTVVPSPRTTFEFWQAGDWSATSAGPGGHDITVSPGGSSGQIDVQVKSTDDKRVANLTGSWFCSS